jgi:hypothetical protein
MRPGMPLLPDVDALALALAPIRTRAGVLSILAFFHVASLFFNGSQVAEDGPLSRLRCGALFLPAVSVVSLGQLFVIVLRKEVLLVLFVVVVVPTRPPRPCRGQST